MVRDLLGRAVQELLGVLGYKPVIATRCREAIELFQENPEVFDAVITEQVMAEMTGLELARELIKIRPGTPIILSTGLTESLSPEEAEAAGVAEYIRRPMAMRQLAEAIRRVLDKKPATTE